MQGKHPNIPVCVPPPQHILVLGFLHTRSIGTDLPTIPTCLPHIHQDQGEEGTTPNVGVAGGHAEEV